MTVKERFRTHGPPLCDHGGREQVVRIGSQVLGRILCGNKFCPSGSHRFSDSFLSCTAGSTSDYRRPLHDTIAGSASLHPPGDTPARRSTPSRGEPVRGVSASPIAGATWALEGLPPPRTPLRQSLLSTSHRPPRGHCPPRPRHRREPLVSMGTLSSPPATRSHPEPLATTGTLSPSARDTVAPRATGSRGVTDTVCSGLPPPRVHERLRCLCNTHE